MGAFHAAIWAAVSTEEQAREDKVSLAAQEESCRALIAGRGWEEVSGRTSSPAPPAHGWVNLRDAEQAILELRRMLDDDQVSEDGQVSEGSQASEDDEAGEVDQVGEHDQ